MLCLLQFTLSDKALAIEEDSLCQAGKSISIFKKKKQ